MAISRSPDDYEPVLAIWVEVVSAEDVAGAAAAVVAFGEGAARGHRVAAAELADLDAELAALTQAVSDAQLAVS